MSKIAPKPNGTPAEQAEWRIAGTAHALGLALRLLLLVIRHGNKRVVVTSYQRFESVGQSAFWLDEEHDVVCIGGS